MGHKKYLPGVYIQSVNHKLYTVEEWQHLFSPLSPNGVAVISEQCSFVVHPTYINASIWGTAVLVEGCTLSVDKNEALNDYQGLINTRNILAGMSGVNNMAYKCHHTLFADGQNGYFPALGEMKILYNNLIDVNACLEAINGSIIGLGAQFWSSTQSSDVLSWSIRFENGEVRSTPKENRNFNEYARPFAVLTF